MERVFLGDSNKLYPDVKYTTVDEYLNRLL